MHIVYGLLILSGAVFAAWSFYRLNKSYAIQSEENNRLTSSLALVNELSVQISSVMDLDRLLPMAMDAFVKAGDVNKGSLMLVNEELGILEISAAVGLSQFRVRTSRPKIGDGIAGIVAKTGQPVLVADISKDKTYYKDFEEDLKLGRPKESILCLPLKYRKRVLGVVNLESKTSGRPFEQRDETVLSILANAIAVSISNARLYQLAITDGLTKLAIHRYFKARLEQEMSRARRHQTTLSLIMLDIDHFKRLNDTYGHPEGDRVLVQIAKLMKECTRDTDLCARYGGEEFAIILPDTPRADAVAVAERFRKKVESTHINLEGDTVSVTVSVGVADMPLDRKLTPAEFIDFADQALYQSKDGGRNKTTIFEALSGKV